MKIENDEPLSENFSEKKKRGRPRLIPAELEKSARQSKPYCDIRTLQNEDYEARAVCVLGIKTDNPSDFPFAWLADFSKIEIGKSQRPAFRKTILSELGRITNDLALTKAATEVCRLKPKTQNAVKMIRGWRLRKPAAPVSFDSALRKAINDYKKQNPDISDDEIYENLTTLADEYFQKALFGNQRG